MSDWLMIRRTVWQIPWETDLHDELVVLGEAVAENAEVYSSPQVVNIGDETELLSLLKK